MRSKTHPRFPAHYYSLHCSHQGYRLAGQTTTQALRGALGIDEFPSLTGGVIVSEGEEVPAAA